MSPQRRKLRSVTILGAAVALAAGVSTGPATASHATAGPAAAAAGPTLAVDVSAARHAISADIYGLNGADPAFAAEIGMPVARWGGNASSRYNYTNHTYNTGSDWYFENIVAGPDKTLEAFVTANQDRGIKQVVTVPMIGWVAKDSPDSHPFNCGFPASRFPTQDDFDQWDPNCGNGKLDGANITGAVPTDTSIQVDPAFAGQMVSHLVSQFGTAAAGGVNIYELDNEPVLWSSTHRDVHPDAVSYDELGGKGTATAAAIKGADPSAAVLGPSGWGYCEWVASGVDGCAPGADAAAHGGLNLSQWYLKNMKDFSDAHGGQRYLDYFDQHYYPQISGGTDPDANALRLRSTRSLWDPSYVEESWIGPGGVNAPPLQFIRTMKAWIAQYYPGTKTAITEYNWGALDTINGALAQADVLGIFGREGLDLATIWGEPQPTQPGAYAFRMYRNYDGAGSRFGDVSVSASSSDQGQLAVYAAQRSSDEALTALVINKTGGDLASPLSVAGFSGTGAAQRFTYSPADLTSIVHGGDLPVTGGTIDATYPANSITLLVLGAGGGDTAPPSTPGTPTVSNVTSTGASLAWTASTDNVGVAGYDVVRVTGTTETSLAGSTTASATLTGLTPGTAYTVAVYARDAAGNRSARSGTTTFTTRSGGGCTATYQVVNQWPGGFQAQVTVTNGETATTAWAVSWTYANGQTVTQVWNATDTASGASHTMRNMPYNGTLAPGARTTFGFLGTWAGSNPVPATTCTRT